MGLRKKEKAINILQWCAVHNQMNEYLNVKAVICSEIWRQQFNDKIHNLNSLFKKSDIYLYTHETFKRYLLCPYVSINNRT